MENKPQLMAIIEPVLEEHGLELVDLELRREPHGQTLRVFADREGGVDLDSLSKISRELSDSLDVIDPVSGAYTLEVSSPGINRPLRTVQHFERVIGKRIRIRLSRPLEDGTRNLVGRLLEIGGDRVTLSADSGETLLIALEDVERANYEHEFSPADFGSAGRKGSSRRGKRTRSGSH